MLKGKFDSGVPLEVITDRDVLMLLTTSFAVLVGCAVIFILHRSSSKASKAVEMPRQAVINYEKEVEDGKKKVTIFFGTQTGTAEGFSKTLAAEANARYEKATFKIVDIDDYAADDDEYEEKIKKETLALFFLATYGDGEPTDNAVRFYKWFTEVAKVVDEILVEQGCNK